MNSKSVVSMIIVVLILLVTKLSGLLRDVIVVSKYGAGHYSDGFFLGLSIVLTLYALVGKAITLYLIPKLNSDDRDYALIKSFIMIGSLVAFAIITLYNIFPEHIIKWFYNGQIDATIKDIFSSAVNAIIFVPAVYAFISYHQSKGQFYCTVLIGLVFNLTIIVSIFAFEYSGKMIFITAMILQLTILSKNVDTKKLLSSKLLSMEYREFYSIGVIAISMAFEQLNVLIDRKYVSEMGSGELTFLDLGSKVSFMFIGIIVLGITTVLYPRLVSYYNEKNYDAFLKTFYRSSALLGILSILSIIMIMMFADTMINIIFVRGKLNPVNTESIVMYLKVYSIVLLPLSIREMMVRVLVIRKKGNYLLITSLLGILLNIYISLNAHRPISVVYGSILGIVISTILLSILFSIEMRIFRNEVN